jgi:hypothetical protein
MEIKQMPNKFEVAKWKSRPFGKNIFSDGTVAKMIHNWGLETNIREGRDQNNNRIIQMTLTLIYSIKGLLDYNGKNVFLIYDPVNRSQEIEYTISAIMNIHSKMAIEFEKRKKAIPFGSPLPVPSPDILLDLARSAISFLRQDK